MPGIGIGISPVFGRGGGGWSPLSLNPSLYFDARNLTEFADNEFADTSNFQQIATIYNQVSGNDATANTDIPIIARQSVFGYDAINLRAGGLTVNNYTGIDFQYNDEFYIAVSFSVCDSGADDYLINKINHATGKSGYFLKYNASNKFSFGFSDVTNGIVREVEMNVDLLDYQPHTLVAHSLDGTIAGVTFYLDGVEQAKTTITNAGALTDIQGSSMKIGTYNPASHDEPPIYISTIIIGAGEFNALTQYASFCERVNRWEVLKYASNPVISGTSQDALQSYPSGGFYWASTDKYYRYVGSTATKIVCFSSDDGYTWVEEGVVVTATGGTWNAVYVTIPMVRVVGSTIYLFITGNASTGSDYEYTCGYYTSSSPTSGFTQNLTPILAAAAYNAVFNNNMTGVSLNDVVKVDGTYYWFGYAIDVCRTQIFYATSSTLTGTITPISIICNYTEIDYKRAVISTPQVFKTSWGWMMIITVGLQGSTDNERNLRCLISTSATPTSWTALNEDYLNPTINEWDDLRVYINSIYKEFADDSFQDLVQISGNYVDYYSGHAISGNLGLTGLLEFTQVPDLRGGRLPSTPSFTATALDSLPNCVSRISSDENCYYTSNGLVYSVLSSVTYKETTPIGADSERPSRIENELNGYPVIRFSAAERLRYGKALGNPASWTATVLVKTSDLTANNFVFGATNTAGGDNHNLIILRTDGAIRGIINDGVNLTATDSPAGEIIEDVWNVVSVSYTNGDDFLRIYKNGVALALTEVLTDATSTGAVVRSMGLGAASFYNLQTLIGDIAYFAFYDDALSGANITAEYNFLALKYSL